MLLNFLRSFLAHPPTAAELAFREQTLRFAQRHDLSPTANPWDAPDWLGDCVAQVFLLAGADKHLRCKTDIRTVATRAAYACFGVTTRAGVTLSMTMMERIMGRFGAPQPTPRPFLRIIHDALDVIEEQRVGGALEAQAEELMIPRYLCKEEPLVLQQLACGLDKHVRLGRQALAPRRTTRSG